jgi:ABC-type polysaccharide/polyol phosphate transport system ATPase subunit
VTTAIELQGVGKRFTKYVDTPMLVTAALRFRPRTRRERLWAIRGVDLSVSDGESVGVIGRNGSGKTTLMSLIAGVTAPTEGSVRVWGRVAPLISVGVGFHRELTGRENIYVNGSILGLSRKEIDKLLPHIIEFAGVADFIDTPVKFYSSGMYVRLGFSVAVHSDPDVLVVDEVLAVGDLGYQVKCYERISEIRKRGTSIVMVSHNMAAVRRMCDRVMLVHDGAPRFCGPAEEAISVYHEFLSSSTELHVDDMSGLRFEPGVASIEAIELTGPDGAVTGHFGAGEPISVRIRARAFEDLDDVIVRITVIAPDGTTVYCDSTAGQPLGSVASGEELDVAASFRAQLPSGTYGVVAQLERPDLRTTLAQSPQRSFFVMGRYSVVGLADLEARFDRCDSPLQPAVSDGGPSRTTHGDLDRDLEPRDLV